jgi:hypothetical protein
MRLHRVFLVLQPTINSVDWQADHGISPSSGQASSAPYIATFTVTQTGQLPIGHWHQVVVTYSTAPRQFTLTAISSELRGVALKP